MGTTRRAFIRISAGGAVGGGAVSLRASCSVAIAPVSPTVGRPTTGPVKSASLLPTYSPVQGAARPDFPSAGPEYEDGFTYYPKNPVKAWQKDSPGRGST